MADRLGVAGQVIADYLEIDPAVDHLQEARDRRADAELIEALDRWLAGLDEKTEFRDLVWFEIGYTPTAAQWAFHNHRCRLKLVAGGVRAGKSNSTAMEFVGECFVDNALIWIVGPDYTQCKPEFDYLFEAFSRLGWVAKASTPEKGARSMTLKNGCRIETKSSDDARALASFAPNALLMVEAGQQTHDIYLKILERALQHNAKVILSGTFEGSLSWYADLYTKWQGPNVENGRSFSFPSWSNYNAFPGGRNDPAIVELESILTPELFAERVAAVPYKPAGLVHRIFDTARNVAVLPFDPTWQTEIAVDPAQHTYAILVIQWKQMSLLEWWYYDHLDLGLYKSRDDVPFPTAWTPEQLKEEWTRVRVVDEIYQHNITAQDIIPLAMAAPWWKYLRDVAGVIDIAGTAKQANKSQTEIWRAEAKKSFRHKMIFIEEGINVVNVRLKAVDPLGVPLLQFSHKLRQDKGPDGRALGILAEFGLYRYPPWMEGKSTTDKPIDANNDACKALAYWLFDRFGPVVERKKRQKRVVKRNYWR